MAKKKTSHTKKPKMTRQEAYNILDQLRWKYMDATATIALSPLDRERYEQRNVFLAQVADALYVLLPAAYGPPRYPQVQYLCQICHGRYTEHFAREKRKDRDTWCCTPCYNQLQAEHKLVGEEAE